MEGPEGVKWELGFACFCTGKMGFRSLGLEVESEKTPKWEWDWCFVSISVGSGHWLVGFGKKWWLGNGIGNPTPLPFRTLNMKSWKINIFSIYFPRWKAIFFLCYAIQVRSPSLPGLLNQQIFC